jgi:hypothetical protein
MNAFTMPCLAAAPAAAAAGAGIGMFTTEPVSTGQLLLVSLPLATVALHPDDVATGAGAAPISKVSYFPFVSA